MLQKKFVILIIIVINSCFILIINSLSNRQNFDKEQDLITNRFFEVSNSPLDSLPSHNRNETANNSSLEVSKDFVLIFDNENTIKGCSLIQACTSFIDDPADKQYKYLKVHYYKVPGIWSVNQLSAIILKSSESGLPSQWNDYEFLELEVYNFSNTIRTLWLTFFEGGPCRTADLQPGKWQKWRIELSSLRSEVDFNEIQELYIFLNQPSEELTIFIRKLTLVQPPLKWYFSHIERLVKNPEILEKISLVDKSSLDSAMALINNKSKILNDVENGKMNKEEEQNINTKARKAYREISIGEKWYKQLEIADSISAIAVRALSDQINEPEYGIGTETSMQKVFIEQDEPFIGNFNTEIWLGAARNEYESAQIVVFPRGKNLENVFIEASDLMEREGIIIPAENIKISPVGYVRLPKHVTSCWSKVNAPDLITWWPDPLLTCIKQIGIDKNHAQPFWVSVYIPEDAKPGRYKGVLTVKPGNSHDVTIKLIVDVYPFVLPNKPTLATVFDIDWQWLINIYIKHLALPLDSVTGISGMPMEILPSEIRKKYLDFLIEYKVFPSQIYRQKWSSTDIDFLKECKNEGVLGQFNIIYLNTRNSPQYYEDLLNQIVPELKKEFIYNSAILYGFDEMAGRDFAQQVPYLEPIKEKYPELKIMITSDADEHGNPWAENSPIKDLIDIWVPQVPLYDRIKADDARKFGKEVWWYICCNPAQPNGMIHNSAIEIRALMGAGAFKQNIDGFLYWSVFYWPDNNKPIESGPFTSWISHSKFLPPGDGNLIYPGEYGPLPTIRLENFRDGMEDYEYYKILEKQVKQLEQGYNISDDELSKARDILSVSWDPYESPSVLYYHKKELANMIFRLNNYLEVK